MHPRIQEVLAYLDRARAELRRAVEGVPGALRDRPPAPGRWSVAQVLEHLSLVEGLLAQRIAAVVAEADLRGIPRESATSSVVATYDPTRVLDRSRRAQAPDRAVPRGGLGADAAWAALEAAGARLREAIASADGLALGTVIFSHPIFGDMHLYHWIVATGGHEMRHAAQVREIGEALAPAA